jgi:iron complex outermembrane receptor protein
MLSRTSISGCGFLATVLAASGAGAQQTTVGASSGPTAAQTTNEPTTLSEIVVTAQRREQALSDVPIAIQAISGESLERQGVKSAADILSQVPSASFQSDTPTQAVLQLRGVSQNPAVDPSVAFYVDEVPLGLPGQPFMPNIEAIDLQRIEVLRGPQGTLYGLGAMGGTVRVITADPSFSEGFGGRVMLEGSSLSGGSGSYTGGLAVNVPLVSDVLAARFTVSDRHDGGWIDDVGRGTHNVNSDDVFDFRGKLLFTPTDKLKIKLTFWRSDIDTKWDNVAYYKNTTVKNLTGTASDPPAFQNTYFNIFAGFVSYDLGFASLEDGLSYYRHNIPARFVIGTATVFGTLVVDTVDHSRAVTNEIRLVSKGDTAFQWIIGDFFRNATRNFFEVGGFAALPLIAPSDTDVNSKSNSVFGEVSYGFADDRVRVLAGARYFQDRRGDRETVSGIQDLNIRPTFNSFNPRFNIAVKPNKDLMVYFNAAKGFRSGIINTSAQTAAANLDGIKGVQIVQPDSIWTYEIGSKVTVLDHTLFIEPALYYSRWNNFQLQATTSANFAFNVNGGDAKIKGFENSITWSTPLKGLSAVVSGSYTDATFVTVSPVVSSHSPLFVPGARLPSVPKWSGNASLNYDAPLAGAGVDMIAGATVTFKDGSTDQSGARNAVTNELIFTDPRTELSLRAGIRKDKWELTAFVNNVTNNETSIVSLTGTGWYSPGPRTVGLRLTGGF